ncbi:VanZ family protein [Paenibacillus arenilitoris]|uniref:VanZ family protein n=1 Tax=Paenibacillus arenilitoris TaxID=2772299 RepID=A0A927CM02_9BACL|nr:VanZ family protein [Paenibacillus arenilitoris]MBD2868301.1 VanZ family protein [Paenibacillus arenilitoris]
MFKNAHFRNVFLNLLIAALGLVYAIFMAWLLFYRDRSFSDGYAFNLVPFDTIKRYVVHYDHFNFDIWFKNLFGNIVLFMPIGIFLPLLHVKYRRVFALTATTVLLIAAVELAQLLSKVGSFDVDDIILNTLGAVLGLVLTRMSQARNNRIAE